MKKIVLFVCVVLASFYSYSSVNSTTIKKMDCPVKENKTDLYASCNGSMILVGTLTITYDCNFKILNIDFWNSQNTCQGSVQDFLLP